MSETRELLAITTPLSDDSFVIQSLTGSEQISRPYEFHALLTGGEQMLDPNSLLDKSVTVTLLIPGTLGRYFNGIVAAVRQVPSDTHSTVWHYDLTIVPKLYFLGQTSDCRFYHAMTAPAIISNILGKFNVPFQNKLTATYTTRDYTVQYNESYLHFLQRIMEDEGIFYFFVHQQSSQFLVVADSKTAFTAITNPDFQYNDPTEGMSNITDFTRVDATALGAVSYGDYNPQTDTLGPNSTAGNATSALGASGKGQRTHYTWPAIRGANADAGSKAQWRSLAADAASSLYTGAGSSPDFFAGGKFTLIDDPNGIDDYVIQSVHFAITDGTNASYSQNVDSSVSTSFTAFPASVDWHDTPVHAPPVMGGLFSALVIGPSGEEIYTDDLGRIKVQFPWDNAGDITADNTFWARVIYPWAGAVWGHQFTPRVGMEVAVAFLEGDVNRPVVVGSLFNGTNTPLFTAADKNKSGIRTRSTIGGSSSTFNELSFDDTKGSELYFLHAEKDYSLEVENDQTLAISNDRNVTVTKDETVKINGKQTITVQGDQSLTVTQGDQSETVQAGNQSVTVTQGNQSVTISAGKQTITVEQDRAITVNSGDCTLTVSSGQISYSAQSQITLTCGQSSVQITPSGVTISGMNVTVNGQTAINISGASTSVAGSGDLSLTGAMISIG